MSNISVILTVYKRPHTLQHQLKAIKNQTIDIADQDIHILVNNPSTAPFFRPEPPIKYYRLNYNSGIFSRFAIALLCKTKYVAILDDDIIPGEKWFENCLQTEIDSGQCLLGASGVFLQHKGYHKFGKVGWNGAKEDKILAVDLVGHSWFCRQKLFQYLWYEEPPNWDNGEDIFFAYCLQKYCEIGCFVPPHPKDDRKLWGNIVGTKFADDQNAMFKSDFHYNDRDNIVKQCCYKGWRLLHEIW